MNERKGLQFRERWAGMDSGGHKRIVALCLILAWFDYLTLFYSYSVYNFDPFYDDGSNVLVSLGLSIAEGFAGFVLLGIYALVILVFALILFLLLRLIGLHGEPYLTEGEVELSRNLTGLAGAISLIGAVVITGFGAQFPAVFYTLLWVAPCFLIYLNPIRKAQ